MRVNMMAAAAAAGKARQRARRTTDDMSGEVALVTGASRGLGLLLARELARQACRLIITARDQTELDQAAERLRSGGAEVVTAACDIRDRHAPQLLLETARKRYGRLDILVNNAGIIQVGPVQNTQIGSYQSALDTMALSMVRMSLTVLPVMRAQGHGRIVNITSIGGKISVPHLLAYSTAKFAAVGFSEGLRAELGPGPVTVTTVVPGLMRTGSHEQALFTGRRDAEYTWFSLAASLPLVSMDAERAARRIVAAVRARRPEVILTPAGQLAARVPALAPGLTSRVLNGAQRLLLPPQAKQGSQPVAGQQLRPVLRRDVFERLTGLGRTAARRFNERPDKGRHSVTRSGSKGRD